MVFPPVQGKVSPPLKSERPCGFEGLSGVSHRSYPGQSPLFTFRRKYDIHPIALRRILKGCHMSQQVIRISELASTPAKPGKLPVSPATIWRWVREGRFPKPFKLSDSVTVWDVAEVDAFIDHQATRVTQ